MTNIYLAKTGSRIGCITSLYPLSSTVFRNAKGGLNIVASHINFLSTISVIATHEYADSNLLACCGCFLPFRAPLPGAFLIHSNHGWAKQWRTVTVLLLLLFLSCSCFVTAGPGHATHGVDSKRRRRHWRWLWWEFWWRLGWEFWWWHHETQATENRGKWKN